MTAVTAAQPEEAVDQDAADGRPGPANLPAVRELGLARQVFDGGLCLSLPNTLAAQARRLNGWLVEALGEADIAQRCRELGIEPTPIGLDAAASLVVNGCCRPMRCS